MTDQTNPVGGVVEGVTDTLERPPELPPSGPWVWIQENLLGGNSLAARIFNGFLSAMFAVLAVFGIRYVTGFLFSDERRWGAVTVNMKFLMVQAYPQDDLWRIWVTVGTFLVLLATTLAVAKTPPRISIHKVALGVRAAAVFVLLTAIVHPAFPISGTRVVLGVAAIVVGLAAQGAAGFYVSRKDDSIPFLSLLALGMVAIVGVIWTIDLPFPTTTFEEGVAPIARTTTGPWTILFALAIGTYFVGRGLVSWLGSERIRKILTILWVASYPVLIMVIQRAPILDWTDILGFGEMSFLASDLGSVALFGIVGGALLWWLGLPESLTTGRAVVGTVVLVTGIGVWLVPEAPTLVKALVTLAAGGAGFLGVVVVKESGEIGRLIGSLSGIVAILVWFVPMLFLYRSLVITFAMVAVAAPSFGGTISGRRRIVLAWLLTVVLMVATFRLGVAETALEFRSTSFLGGFNLTILLAITGVVLSFPLGAVLALARTSTMPIFRLLATGYIGIVRSVPLITWLFFGSVMIALFLPEGVSFDEILRVVAAVSIFSAAYVAENLRGGLQAVGRGQYEAARAMGLTTVQSTTLIIMPQAIRAVIPALVGSVIVGFKDTSLVAIIGLADVLWIARTAIPGQSSPFNFLGTLPQMMFFMAIFYWMFTFTFSRLALRYEKSLGLGER